MKKLFYIGAILFSNNIIAQKIQLSGKLASAPGKTLELSSLNEQKWIIKVDDGAQFNQSFTDIEKGYYNLSEVGNLYLEPGFNLKISKDADGIEFSGNGSEANNLLKKLNKNISAMSNEVREGKMNMVPVPEFLKKMEAWKKQQQQLFIKLQKSNPVFFSDRKEDIGYAARNIIREYMYVYGVDMKKRESFFELLSKMAGNFDKGKLDSARKEMEIKTLTKEERVYIDSINNTDISMNNEALFKASANYRKWMDQLISAKVYSKEYRNDFDNGMKSAAIQTKIVNKEISNAFIREYWKYDLAAVALKMSEDMAEADSVYNAYSTTAANKTFSDNISVLYNKMKKYSKGATAPEFNYRTVSGEKISLSSLRGNLVYIDVWATWCGPCKAEIPHLKKLEEEYHGKPVSFVSISVDELKDTEKWIAYVTDNKLKGVQLMADNAFNATFIQEFNIAAIPRFIMIDKEGKIISANALRPSSKKIKEELNKYLAL